MKIGDMVRDPEFYEDMGVESQYTGILIAFDEDQGVQVFCINNSCVTWLPLEYIQECEVLNESR